MRYGKGCNLMALLQTVLTDGDGAAAALADLAQGDVDASSANIRDLYDFKHWSERTVIALVMQTPRQLDHDLHQEDPGSASADDLAAGPRHPEPDLDPGRQRGRTPDGADRSAARAGGSIGEPFNRPLTAHFIGGCTIGDSAETGVIDPYQRVYGHPGLHVADGSAISANLGVNPSLTITAQAERAMAFWPNKGEADPRPRLGAAYERARAGGARLPGRPGRRSGRAAAADRRGQLTARLGTVSVGKNFCRRRVTRSGTPR